MLVMVYTIQGRKSRLLEATRWGSRRTRAKTTFESLREEGGPWEWEGWVNAPAGRAVVRPQAQQWCGLLRKKGQCRGEALLKADTDPSSPLPTQSTMRTLPTFSFCCRSLVVMATELKKQKPLVAGSGEKTVGEVSCSRCLLPEQNRHISSAGREKGRGEGSGSGRGRGGTHMAVDSSAWCPGGRMMANPF